MPVKKIDRSAPEYKRGVIAMLLFVTTAGLIGGTVLGMRISAAEEAAVERARAERPEDFAHLEQDDAPAEPPRKANESGKSGEPANGYW